VLVEALNPAQSINQSMQLKSHSLTAGRDLAEYKLAVFFQSAKGQ